MTLLVAAVQESAEPAASRIDYRITALADLYSWVRSIASVPAAADTPTDDALPGIADAVAAARAIDRKLGSALAWGVLDRELEFCATADELASRFEKLPERVTTGGGEAAIRDDALALAAALGVVEARFLDELWPGREAAIGEAKARLELTFVPHERECLGDVLARFELPDPRVVIPLFLVLDAPPPGGVTFLRAERGGICFVAVRDAPGTQLDETVLHECTHALDVASPYGVGLPDEVGLINELRAKLSAAGLGPRDRRVHDVWHTIYFAHAAATIRRRVDPEHRPYGEVSGYYAKVPAVAAIVLPRWEKHLAGELDRAALLDELVAETMKLPSPRRG